MLIFYVSERSLRAGLKPLAGRIWPAGRGLPMTELESVSAVEEGHYYIPLQCQSDISMMKPFARPTKNEISYLNNKYYLQQYSIV